jgi:hypothetical protein
VYTALRDFEQSDLDAAQAQARVSVSVSVTLTGRVKDE